MTFADLVTRVKSQGGFDASDQEVKDELNRKYDEIIAFSGWRKAEVALATTVADQSEYALPTNEIDLEAITISDSEYERVGGRDVRGLKSGRLRLSLKVGYGGVFAPAFASDGSHKIELYPAPDSSGVTIVGIAAITPVALAADGDTPIIPADSHEGLADGAIAGLMMRLEQRPDLAAPFEQRWQATKEMVRRRLNSRVGSGPVRMPVVGYSA